jgi:GntR family transcriptional repressor for pyruvate dehydrogenase complex
VMERAHAEFHAAVAKATANPLFELITRPLYQVTFGGELIDTAPVNYWRRIDADHRELLGLIEAREPEGATSSARRHLDFVASL